MIIVGRDISIAPIIQGHIGPISQAMKSVILIWQIVFKMIAFIPLFMNNFNLRALEGWLKTNKMNKGDSILVEYGIRQ